MLDAKAADRRDEADRTPRWGRRGRAAVSFAASLDFDHVSHSYGHGFAIRDITLSVEPGEVLCLLGQSGCGKTTLLRIAAGIEQPTSGTVRLNGQEIAGPNCFVPPEKRGIGLVFQDYALFPHMSVIENVQFGVKRLPRADADAACRLALERVGLLHYAEKYPHMLSGGEQQRVALARAIAPRPAVLLMDEPFSGLDKRLRDTVRAETLAVLRETRTTSVFVTHDPEEAMRVADRIALLRGGRLVQIGSPDNLYRHPVDLTCARFFSEINELTGTVERGRIATPAGIFPADGLADGVSALVCFRPQAITVSFDPNCGLAGRVLSRQFLGEMDVIEVAIAGREEPLLARMPASLSTPGHEVGITVDPAQAFIFPAQ